MLRTTATNPRDGVHIGFDVDGPEDSAAAVLFLHGAGLTRASWRGLGYVRALRGKRRVLAADLRGHGLSDRPHDTDSYRRERFLDDVLAVLDEVDVESVHLVGYSFGARVALDMAIAHPRRVLSATLIGGTPAPLTGQVATTFFPGYEQALRDGGMEAFVSGWEARRGEPVDSSTRMVFLRNDPLALAAFFAQGEREPGVTDSALTKIEPPVQWITGDLDRPRYEQSLHAARLMDAPFIPLHGRTHSATLFPSADVIDQITSFIDFQ